MSSRAFRGRDGDENDPGFARFGRGSSEIEAGARLWPFVYFCLFCLLLSILHFFFSLFTHAFVTL